MGAFVCDGCKRDFESEEARCPECLRKSTVREAKAWVSETEALAASDEEPSSRMGLQLGLIGLSLVVSLVLLAMYLSFDHTLSVLRGEYPAVIGLVMGSIVSLRMAPRFAIEDDHPLRAYAKWMGIAALVGTSVTIAGLLGTWMFADTSVALAVVVAVVLWLGAAIPAFNYGVRAVIAREKASPARPAGKWR